MFLNLCFTSSQVTVGLLFPFITIWTCSWVKFLVNTLKSNKNPVNMRPLEAKPIIRLVEWILCVGALMLQSLNLLWSSIYKCAKVLEKNKANVIIFIRFKIHVHTFYTCSRENWINEITTVAVNMKTNTENCMLLIVCRIEHILNMHKHIIQKHRLSLSHLPECIPPNHNWKLHLCNHYQLLDLLAGIFSFYS